MISRCFLKECCLIEGSFNELLEQKAALLTPYGTVIRYPDDFYMPDIEETSEAVKLAETVKSFVQAKLHDSGFDHQF